MRPRGLVVSVAAFLVAAGLVVALTGSMPWSPSWPWASDREARASAGGSEAPAPEESGLLARLAVAGDTGTGDAAQVATVEAMVEYGGASGYDALLLLGDLVYEDGDPALLEHAVLGPFAPLLDAGAELVPVLGNHDYRSGRQDRILTDLGRDTRWYVERVGAFRIVVLDSNVVDDPAQTAWLQDVLASPQEASTWTIVAMHHPAYSAGYHGSNLQVREAWAGLFAEYEVPLVLAGHDHDYQRSLPQDGVTHVVSGGGARLRPVGNEDFTAVSASTLHFVDLSAYGDRLVGRAIDQSGYLVDEFVIAR